MRKCIVFLGLLASATHFSACKNEEVNIQGDYFPTLQRSDWRYLNRYSSSFDGAPWYTDTTIYRIEKDTVAAGKRYALLTDSQNFLKRGIRKENGNYFYRSFQYFDTGKEYLFLKDNQPIGSNWEEISSNGYLKHVYTVEDKPANKNIQGKSYQQLIGINEAVYLKDNDTFKLHYQIKHLYARGVGEVYAYYPYPSFKIYGDQKVEILDHR
jgi:hypothetical protein